MEMDIEAVDSDGDRTIDPETDNGVIHNDVDYIMEWGGDIESVERGWFSISVRLFYRFNCLNIGKSTVLRMREMTLFHDVLS